MKRLVFRISVVLFVLMGTQQFSYAQYFKKEWAKKYPGPVLYQTFYSVQETKDGHLVTAGNKERHSGEGGFAFFKMDATGNLLIDSCNAFTPYDWANSIKQTSDGGYILAGQIYADSMTVGNGLDFCVYKLDSLGREQWHKVIGGIYYEGASSVQQLADGGFIAAGYGNRDPHTSKSVSDYLVVRLDSLGNIIWQKTFGGSDNDEACTVLSTKDGGFVVAGTTMSGDGEAKGNMAGTWGMLVIKLDSAGNVVWNKVYKSKLGTDGTVWNMNYANGGFVIVGPYIIKINENGIEQWQKELQISYAYAAYSIMQTNDRGFVLCGIYFDTNESHVPECGWVGLYDSLGNYQVSTFLSWKDYGPAYSVIQTKDSGFVVAGGLYYYDAYIIKYYPLKVIHTGEKEIEPQAISLYPNPAADEIIFSVPVASAVSVCNLWGQQVYQSNNQEGRITLDVSAYPPGIYMLRVISGESIEEQKFVVQH